MVFEVGFVNLLVGFNQLVIMEKLIFAGHFFLKAGWCKVICLSRNKLCILFLSKTFFIFLPGLG